MKSKRLISLLLVSVLLLLCVGCSAKELQLTQGVLEETELYTTSRTDGALYITFHQDPGVISCDPFASIQLAARGFDTYDAMWTYFTGDEIGDVKWIQVMHSITPDRPIKLFDVNAVPELILPSGWEFLRPEKGDGSGCWLYTYMYTASISMDGTEDSNGYFACYFDEEDYRSSLESALESVEKIVPEKTEKEFFRGATRYIYLSEDDGAEQSVVRYEFGRDGRKQYVIETYGEDPEIPENVSLYGESSEGYFHVYLCDLTERPSMGTLRSFGLKAYGTTPIPSGLYWTIGIASVLAVALVSVLVFRRIRKRKRSAAERSVCSDGLFSEEIPTNESENVIDG